MMWLAVLVNSLVTSYRQMRWNHKQAVYVMTEADVPSIFPSEEAGLLLSVATCYPLCGERNKKGGNGMDPNQKYNIIKPQHI